MNMKRCIRAAACLLLTLLAALPAPPAQAAAVTNVKVAVDCKLPPFQYVGDDGVLKGMHIDLMNEIARRGNLKVEYVVFERTMDAVDALVAGEVDAVLVRCRATSAFTKKSSSLRRRFPPHPPAWS